MPACSSSMRRATALRPAPDVVRASPALASTSRATCATAAQQQQLIPWRRLLGLAQGPASPPAWSSRLPLQPPAPPCPCPLRTPRPHAPRRLACVGPYGPVRLGEWEKYRGSVEQRRHVRLYDCPNDSASLSDPSATPLACAALLHCSQCLLSFLLRLCGCFICGWCSGVLFLFLGIVWLGTTAPLGLLRRWRLVAEGMWSTGWLRRCAHC